MKRLILILIGFIALDVGAQEKQINIANKDDDVKAIFNVYLDNKKVETDSVSIGFVTNNTMKQYCMVSDSFTTFFLPNRTYHMVITHPGYNRQMLRINTSKEDDHIKIDIKLTKGSPDCYIGYYKYNKLLKKYVEYN